MKVTMCDTLTLELPMTPETDGRGGCSCAAPGSALEIAATLVAQRIRWAVKNGADEWWLDSAEKLEAAMAEAPNDQGEMPLPAKESHE